jgi:hypothetical protein
MVSGLRELSSNGGMTGVAKVRLRALEQTVFKPSDVVCSLGYLKELLLAKLKIAATVIFDFVDKVT